MKFVEKYLGVKMLYRSFDPPIKNGVFEKVNFNRRIPINQLGHVFNLVTV